MSYAYQTAALTDREQLAHWYTLDVAGAAAAFLDAHPGLTPLLLEAYPVLVQHFPRGDLGLAVDSDPEGWDRSDLVILINPGCAPKQAIEDFEAFKQTWWLANMKRAQGALFIHIEYR